MLVYHRALDPYHAIVRMLRLFAANPSMRIEKEQLRLLDFCLLFPEILLREFRLTKELRRTAKKAEVVAERYSGLTDAALGFRRVKPIQEHAVLVLEASNFVAREGEMFRVGNGSLAYELRQIILARNLDEPVLTELVAVQLAAIPFKGKDGLKDRSGLLEYRYDAY